MSNATVTLQFLPGNRTEIFYFFLSVNEYTRRTIYRAVDLAAHEHCVLNSTTFRAHELRLENIFLVVLYTDSGVRTAVSQQLIAIGTVKICIIANSLVKTKVSTDSVFNKILTQQQLLGFWLRIYHGDQIVVTETVHFCSLVTCVTLRTVFLYIAIRHNNIIDVNIFCGLSDFFFLFRDAIRVIYQRSRCEQQRPTLRDRYDSINYCIVKCFSHYNIMFWTHSVRYVHLNKYYRSYVIHAFENVKWRSRTNGVSKYRRCIISIIHNVKT